MKNKEQLELSIAAKIILLNSCFGAYPSMDNKSNPINQRIWNELQKELNELKKK